MQNKIVKIEFFPDYSAHGVWITREGETRHRASDLDELGAELCIDFPQWFRNMVEASQHMYDVFEPYDEHAFVERYNTSSKHMVDWDLIEHIIISRFKDTFPEHAALVAYTKGNHYNWESHRAIPFEGINHGSFQST